MRLNTVEGVFAIASDYLANPYLVLFALQMGASPLQVGFLNAVPVLLGNLLQIPYGILAERTGRRRMLLLMGSFILRFSWLFIAFVPLAVPLQWRVPVLIVLASLRVGAGQLATPVWTAIQAEIIPRQMRGRYYANRNMILHVMGLGATFAAGWFLAFVFPVNYQVLFAAAAGIGLVSTAVLVRMPIADLPPTEGDKGHVWSLSALTNSFFSAFRAPNNFSGYVVSALVWHVAISMAGPLVSLYYIRELQGAEEFWAVVTAAAIVSTILSQRYWGRLIDRFGQKPVMLVAGVGAVLIPFWWFVIPSSYLAVAANFWAGFMWGGYNLAAFNLLLDITPNDHRPMYIGIFNTTIGIASATGPLVGGLIAQYVGLRPVFILSMVLRALGLWLFRRNVDEGRTGPQMRMQDLIKFRRASGKSV